MCTFSCEVPLDCGEGRCGVDPESGECSVMSSSSETIIDGTTGAAVTPLVGGGEDENGCCATCGFTWCEHTSSCVQEWETPCVAPAEALDEVLLDGGAPADKATSAPSPAPSFTTWQGPNGVSYSLDSCTAAFCCHSDTCVPVSEAPPDCSEFVCDMSCAPDTTDCGGFCIGGTDGSCLAVVLDENGLARATDATGKVVWEDFDSLLLFPSSASSPARPPLLLLLLLAASLILAVLR
ncbi:hypothetical protein TeGR_g1236 [Tetraparma gracilis]|uniref:Uncharacterized protein n=1 Tax=Tetraparma gracilis TaxID=2962635 RepID=A0ABQ6MJ99_9STRA|nr:hypothetical protein TeGR_g1236 [Tetraparma gracilis]